MNSIMLGSCRLIFERSHFLDLWKIGSVELIFWSQNWKSRSRELIFHTSQKAIYMNLALRVPTLKNISSNLAGLGCPSTFEMSSSLGIFDAKILVRLNYIFTVWNSIWKRRHVFFMVWVSLSRQWMILSFASAYVSAHQSILRV